MKTTNNYLESTNDWHIDESIDFSFFNEAYTSGHANLNDITAMIACDCGIREDDNSTWANDVRDILCYCVIVYDRALTDDYNGDDVTLRDVMYNFIAPALKNEHEATDTVQYIQFVMDTDRVTGEGYYSDYEKAIFLSDTACA